MTHEATPPIETIMMVDDEEVDQMLYGRIVERSDHAKRIVSFQDAKKALTHLVDASEPVPELVLLDVNMPNMDGFGFLSELATRMDNASAPIIVMLTTSFNPADEKRAREFDLVHGFRNKPLTDGMLGEFRQMVAEIGRSAA